MAFFKFFVEGVCTALLGIFGIVGNIVSIKVLSSRDLDMLPTFRHLLKMLAGFDATFLFFALTLFCASSLSEYYDTYCRPWLVPYMLPLLQIALTGSVWTTTAVSVERYVTVCHSYRPKSIQYLYYTIPIMGFSLIFNIPHFFELTTQVNRENETYTDVTTGKRFNITLDKPIVVPTEIRKSPQYSRDYVLIANSLALVFIPMVALIILNTLIYRTVSQATKRHNAISSNQRRDHKVAMMLLTIVVVFFICHSIRSIINSYECFQMAIYGELKVWPEWIKILVNINHFALVVNSSINILIYCCKDEKFLQVLLISSGLRRSHLPPTPNLNQNAVRRVATPKPELKIENPIGTGNSRKNSLFASFKRSAGENKSDPTNENSETEKIALFPPNNHSIVETSPI